VNHVKVDSAILFCALVLRLPTLATRGCVRDMEQKRFAAWKLETFRLAGMMEAMEKSRQATTISATVQ
jgi:hypothetical protein